jgi:hypothetical protein
MQLVRAGLHGVVDVAATRLAIFGGVIAGFNRYFLDGVGGRLIDLGERFQKPLLESCPSMLMVCELDGMPFMRSVLSVAKSVPGSNCRLASGFLMFPSPDELKKPAGAPDSVSMGRSSNVWVGTV